VNEGQQVREDQADIERGRRGDLRIFGGLLQLHVKKSRVEPVAVDILIQIARDVLGALAVNAQESVHRILPAVNAK